MKLQYILILLFNIVSCYKSYKHFNANHPLASSNIEVTSNKGAEKVIPARYKVNKRIQHDPVFEPHSLHYFPQMEYPRNVIETTKPFYFDSAGSDAFLSAFPSDVISNYQSILLKRPKRLQNSQSSDNSIIELLDEIKAIYRDIIVAKEEQGSETENSTCINKIIVDNADFMSSPEIMDSIYCGGNFNNVEKHFERLQEYNESKLDAKQNNTFESIQKHCNIFTKNNFTSNFNLSDYELDLLSKYIIKKLLIDCYDDYNSEDTSVTEEVYIHENLNMITLLDLLNGTRSLIKNETLECEVYSQDSTYSNETYLAPSYNISEFTTLKEIPKSETILIESNEFENISNNVTFHPKIKVSPTQPQLRSKYKNQILQRKT